MQTPCTLPKGYCPHPTSPLLLSGRQKEEEETGVLATPQGAWEASDREAQEGENTAPATHGARDSPGSHQRSHARYFT